MARARKPIPEPFPPPHLTLPDADTLDALSDVIDTERRRQAEVNEERRRNGGIWDSLLGRWVPA